MVRFYTACYFIMLLLPPRQGLIARLHNNTMITFDIAGIFLLVAVPLLMAFDRFAERKQPFHVDEAADPCMSRTSSLRCADWPGRSKRTVRSWNGVGAWLSST